MLYKPSKCYGCGVCRAACKNQAIKLYDLDGDAISNGEEESIRRFAFSTGNAQLKINPWLNSRRYDINKITLPINGRGHVLYFRL